MNNIETERNRNKIGYQFTAIPTQLMYLCDVNVRSALFGLIQISSEFADEDGWVFRTNEDLQNDMKLSQHLVVATIDTLYRKGIVSVRPQAKRMIGKKTPPNYYRLNYDKFKDYEGMDFNSLRNPDLTIETVKYKEKGYKPMYIMDEEQNKLQSYSNASIQDNHRPTEKVPTNINNTKNKEYEYIMKDEVSENINVNSNENINIEMQDRKEHITVSQTEYEHRGQQFRERNEAISRLFTQTEADIRLFKESKTDWIAADHARRIEKNIRWGYEHKDYFTQKQWSFFISKGIAFRKLSEYKEAYFKRDRNAKCKPQPKNTIMESTPITIDSNHTPPTPIWETCSSDEILTAEEVMKAFEDTGNKVGIGENTYYSLNEITLRTEEMNDKERDYFDAEEGRLTDPCFPG